MRPRSKSVSASTAEIVAGCQVSSNESDEDSDAEHPPCQTKDTDASTSTKWPAADSLTLLQSILARIPSTTYEPFEETLKTIDWRKIVVKNYTVEDLKAELDRQLLPARKFRTLVEILDERQKKIFPTLGIEKPLPAFALFMRDHKEKITRLLPKDAKQGTYCSIAATLFQNEDEKIKKKYKDLANKLKAEYKEATKLYKVPKNRLKIIQKANEIKIPVDLYIQTKCLENPNAKFPELRREYGRLPNNKKLSWILRWLALRKGEKANLEQYQQCKKLLTKQELEIFDEYEGRPRLPSAYNLFVKDHTNKSAANCSSHDASKFEEWRNLPEVEKAAYKAEAKKIKNMFTVAMIEFVTSLPADRRNEEVAALSRHSLPSPRKHVVKKPTSEPMHHVKEGSEEEEAGSDADETIFACDSAAVQTSSVRQLTNESTRKVRTPTAKSLKEKQATDFVSPFRKITDSSFDENVQTKNRRDKAGDKSSAKWNQKNPDSNAMTDDSDDHSASNDEHNRIIMSPSKHNVSKRGGFQKIKDPDQSIAAGEKQVVVERKQDSPRKGKSKKEGTLSSPQKKNLNTSHLKNITDEVQSDDNFSDPAASSTVRKRRNSLELPLQKSKRKKLHSNTTSNDEVGEDIKTEKKSKAKKSKENETWKTKDNDSPASDYSFNLNSENESSSDEINDTSKVNARLQEILRTKPPGTLVEFFAQQNFKGAVILANSALNSLSNKEQKSWKKKYDKAKKKFEIEYEAFLKTLTQQELDKLDISV